MVQGAVKRVLRHADGYLYGFVTRDDGAGEVFFHESSVDPGCLPRLAAGSRVELEVEPGRKGPRAKRLRLIE
jgi:cold shock CspA family protein